MRDNKSGITFFGVSFFAGRILFFMGEIAVTRKLIFRETYENLTGIPTRKDYFDGDFQRDIEGHFIPAHSHGLPLFPDTQRTSNTLLFLESLVLFSEACYVDLAIFRHSDRYEAELCFGDQNLYRNTLSSLCFLLLQCDCCRMQTETAEKTKTENPSCTLVLEKHIHDVRLSANVLL